MDAPPSEPREPAPRKVCILQPARLNSTRVPLKLLQKIGGVRLIDRGLDLIKQVSEHSGIPALLACCPREQELVDAAKPYPVEILPMEPASTEAETWNDIFSQFVPMLKDRFEWVCSVNFLCSPFLKLESAMACVVPSLTAVTPYITTIEQRGKVWDESRRCIVGDGLSADTKLNPVFHTLANLADACPTWMLADEETYYRETKPLPIDVSPMQRIDVDSPSDLEFARFIAGPRHT